MYKLHLKTLNGFSIYREFPDVPAAYYYANHNVSFSAFTRIELIFPDGSRRALWDRNWDTISYREGLQCPK